MYWKLKDLEVLPRGRYIIIVEIRDKIYGKIIDYYFTERTTKISLSEYFNSWKTALPEKAKTFMLVHFDAIKRDINKLLVKEML